MDAPGRPRAHGEFLKVWDHVLGHIPLEEERWRRFDDFYINSIRTMDLQIANLSERARRARPRGPDHRRLHLRSRRDGGRTRPPRQGPIRLRGRHSHPADDYASGRHGRADVPGADESHRHRADASGDGWRFRRARRATLAGRDLPGKDLTPVLGNPGSADLHAAREGILFTYSGLSTNDAWLFAVAGEAIAAGKNPKRGMKASGYQTRPEEAGQRPHGLRRTVQVLALLRAGRTQQAEHPRRALQGERRRAVRPADRPVGERQPRRRQAEERRRSITTMSGKLEALIKAEIGRRRWPGDAGSRQGELDGGAS